MVRIAVSLLLVAACDVGALPGFGPDASMMTGGGDGSGSQAVCETISATPPEGHHNPGLGCMSAGQCHNEELGLGPLAPAYVVGGTIFMDTAGTIPYPGATVFVKVGATEKKIITADNGNFWLPPGLGLDPPTNTMTGTTRASACPDTKPMVGLLVQGGGDCNSCHRTPGGTTLPMYLIP